MNGSFFTRSALTAFLASVLSACTPGAEDHGAIDPYKQPYESAPPAFGLGLPDSNVPDVVEGADTGPTQAPDADATTTTQDAKPCDINQFGICT